MTCLLLYNLHDCTFKYLRQILVIVIIHLQNSKLNKDFRPVMRRLKNMRMFDIIYLRLKRIYFFHKRLYCQFFFLLIFTFKKNNIAPLHNVSSIYCGLNSYTSSSVTTVTSIATLCYTIQDERMDKAISFNECLEYESSKYLTFCEYVSI